MTRPRIDNFFLIGYLIWFTLFLVFLPDEEYHHWNYDLFFGLVLLMLFVTKALVLKSRSKRIPVIKIAITYKLGMVEWTIIILSLIMFPLFFFMLWSDGYNTTVVTAIISISVSFFRLPKSKEYIIEKNHLYAPGQKPMDIQKITFLEINEKANLDVGYEGKIIEVKEWDTDLLRMVRDKLMELNPSIKSSSEI